MLLFLLNHKLLSGLIWLSIVCGVSVQIIMGVCMQRFVEEMDQISVSKNVQDLSGGDKPRKACG